jgi:hypothetical protein
MCCASQLGRLLIVCWRHGPDSICGQSQRLPVAFAGLPGGLRLRKIKPAGAITTSGQADCKTPSPFGAIDTPQGGRHRAGAIPSPIPTSTASQFQLERRKMFQRYNKRLVVQQIPNNCKAGGCTNRQQCHGAPLVGRRFRRSRCAGRLCGRASRCGGRRDPIESAHSFFGACKIEAKRVFTPRPFPEK